MPSHFFLAFLGLLFCAGDVAALGFVLTWQERAASPRAKFQRMVRGVLPATALLPRALLLAFVQIMLLWSGQ